MDLKFTDEGEGGDWNEQDSLFYLDLKVLK
jgi:hypothetical protein